MEIKKGGVYRHHSGRVYTVLDIANRAAPSAKFPPTVVYMGTNGNTWARPAGEFAEKFTALYDGTNLAPAPED